MPTRTHALLVARGNSHQRDQVPRVLAAEVSAAAEDDQSHQEDCIGNVTHPGILPNKFLGVVNKGEDGNEGECDQKLHREHQEHLRGRQMLLLRSHFQLILKHQIT